MFNFINDKIYALMSNPIVLRDLDGVINGFTSTKTEVLNFAQEIWISIAVIVLVASAIGYMIGGGNEREVTKIKGAIVCIIISGILVFSADNIITWIKGMVIGG